MKVRKSAVWAGLPAQPREPFQSQGSSTIAHSVKDGEETVEINNVSYQITEYGQSIPCAA